MKKLSIGNSVRKQRFLKDEMTQKDLAQKIGVITAALALSASGQILAQDADQDATDEDEAANR